MYFYHSYSVKWETLIFLTSMRGETNYIFMHTTIIVAVRSPAGNSTLKLEIEVSLTKGLFQRC